MNLRPWIEGWRFVLLLILIVTLLRSTIEFTQDDFEISLKIGEPWQQMRERSFAAIGPVPTGSIWSNQSRSGVRLRFIDPEFGFSTPLARDFRIVAKSGKVGRVRLSPQMQPLSLDEALTVVLGLHNQLRSNCWVEARVMEDPAMVDTPEWRAWFEARNHHAMSFWLAADKYQLVLEIEPFHPRGHRSDKRYRVVLKLDEVWLPIAKTTAADDCAHCDKGGTPCQPQPS